ncbi:putative ORFan [Tupanvirus deep ocean]|uniref:ORFan n=2 Tax=Tupanvirus TaxID=2094720 RepID=A0AC62A811_9VIRU|nr:putative ORFan [Tupanvirus deep ocean]QKU33783.1 putative ORFan [Tupanvirus deep ocean]
MANPDRKVTINGVEFSINQLTTTFPNSYFDAMFNSSFNEKNKTNVNINFPKNIDETGKNGSRFMKQINFRLENGYYQMPYIDNEPSSHRFLSESEMERVFGFLGIDENEMELIENDSIENEYDDEYEPDDNYDDDYLNEDLLGNYEYEKEQAWIKADEDFERWYDRHNVGGSSCGEY